MYCYLCSRILPPSRATMLLSLGIARGLLRHGTHSSVHVLLITVSGPLSQVSQHSSSVSAARFFYGIGSSSIHKNQNYARQQQIRTLADSQKDDLDPKERERRERQEFKDKKLYTSEGREFYDQLSRMKSKQRDHLNWLIRLSYLEFGCIHGYDMLWEASKSLTRSGLLVPGDQKLLEAEARSGEMHMINAQLLLSSYWRYFIPDHIAEAEAISGEMLIINTRLLLSSYWMHFIPDHIAVTLLKIKFRIFFLIIGKKDLFHPHLRRVEDYGEVAVKIYTECLEDIDHGPLEHWKTLPAPGVAVKHLKLKPGSTMRDLILTIRADKAYHSRISHYLASHPGGEISLPKRED